tara:strand:- start:2425 stop:2856 length:432 start_codon:yes stop_codon:yes gene_type:complete
MPIQIQGVAHPTPPSIRSHPADLTAAEIESTNLSGRPLLNEHIEHARIGTCLASWPGRDGSLRILANVEDESMASDIKSGKMRGLSLGTDLVGNENGEVLFRGQRELSVCEEGRRSGTWIDHINGKQVHRFQRASSKQHPPCH